MDNALPTILCCRETAEAPCGVASIFLVFHMLGSLMRVLIYLLSILLINQTVPLSTSHCGKATMMQKP